MELRERFGLQVKSYRQRRGMTQADLAAAAGMSDTMISRIELGASGARFPNIQKLADVLKIDASQLFMVEAASEIEVRRKLADLTVTLSALSDSDLDWVSELLSTALKARR